MNRWAVPIFGVLLIFVTLIFLGFRNFKSTSKLTSIDSVRSLEIQNRQGETNKILDVSSTNSSRKILILWATWCEPCRSELIQLNKVINIYQNKGFEFVFVNVDEGIKAEVISKVDLWKRETKLNFEDHFDFRGKLIQELGITGLPFSLMFNEQGGILWAFLGEYSWASTEDTLKILTQ